MVHPDSGKNRAKSLQRQPNKQPSLVHKAVEEWRVVAAVGVWLAVAISGGLGVWFFSSAFDDLSVAVNFTVTSVLSLSMLLVVLAQGFIYWGQRNLMQKQWLAMRDQLGRVG